VESFGAAVLRGLIDDRERLEEEIDLNSLDIDMIPENIDAEGWNDDSIWKICDGKNSQELDVLVKDMGVENDEEICLNLSDIKMTK
ncbi:hypothetical protein ACJX0J_008365, partial [Zea mays]